MRCPGCGRTGCPNPRLECGGEGRTTPRKRKPRRASGGILDDAFARWRTVRADFDLHLEAQLNEAEAACAGILLNTRGRAAGIDPRSLFYGPRTRVDAYASEELLDWFHEHGRTTYATFERHHPEARP